MKIDKNILSVDLGYSSLKFCYKLKNKQIVGKIPTAIQQLPENTKLTEYYEYDGKKFVVGDYAIRKGVELSLSVDDLIYYAPLLIYALIKEQDIDTKDLQLVTGVSIKDLDIQTKLIEQLSNFTVNGENIKLVGTVLPQGRGIAYDFFKDEEMPETTIVIDIGYHTLDFITLYDGKMDLDDSFANSDGINIILQNLSSDLLSNKGIERSTSELNKMLSSGKTTISYKGAEIDIKGNLKKAVLDYLNRIKTLLGNRELTRTIERASLIIIGGGGAYLLQSVENEKISNVFQGAKITFCDEPYEFANAKGYYFRQSKGE